MSHKKVQENLDVRQKIAQPSIGFPVRIYMLNETQLDLIKKYKTSLFVARIRV